MPDAKAPKLPRHQNATSAKMQTQRQFSICDAAAKRARANLLRQSQMHMQSAAPQKSHNTIHSPQYMPHQHIAKRTSEKKDPKYCIKMLHSLSMLQFSPIVYGI